MQVGSKPKQAKPLALAGKIGVPIYAIDATRRGRIRRPSGFALAQCRLDNWQLTCPYAPIYQTGALI